MDHALPLNEIKSLTVRLGLIFVHNKTGYASGRRYAIRNGRMCLCAHEDLACIEHYLWGYRDGRRAVYLDIVDPNKLRGESNDE